MTVKVYDITSTCGYITVTPHALSRQLVKMQCISSSNAECLKTIVENVQGVQCVQRHAIFLLKPNFAILLTS